MVFVLDRRRRPLMPCTQKRARLLLRRGRAAVHRLHPFTIRLKDRLREDGAIQPVALKIDPGSKVSGLAIVREEQDAGATVHHAVHLAELAHRGADVRRRLQRRAGCRRRRRSANLRHRAPRFANRRRDAGRLPPSLRSRADNVAAMTRRYSTLAPIQRVDMESARFDTHKLINPEIAGVEYQRGTLFGCEAREYLLEKWGRQCTYCKAQGVPLQIEHVVPKSRGGSNRISNLALSCQPCNETKGNRTAAEFGHPGVQDQARMPLRDAAAVNSTRWAIVKHLQSLGFAVRCWTGGRTKWNRTRLGLPKTHAVDALCVGEMATVTGARLPVLTITATGRGQRQRTNMDASGFPRGYRMRRKRVHGFATGDLVRADVPRGRHAGRHVGRVAVRASGWFRVGQADGILWRHCVLICRTDGYDYHLKGTAALSAPEMKPGASSAA
jgi:5-methylcytosine-specific restriction endonuclease McrA